MLTQKKFVSYFFLTQKYFGRIFFSHKNVGRKCWSFIICLFCVLLMASIVVRFNNINKGEYVWVGGDGGWISCGNCV